MYDCPDDSPEIDEIEGYTRGEKVRVIEDSYEGDVLEGDEGIIVGLHRYEGTRLFGGPSEVLYVSLDYMDDEEYVEVDPFIVEPV